MKAAIFANGSVSPNFLEIKEVPRPVITSGYLLVKVLACGVCRTDLHIVERDLPPILEYLIPGHQIVGEVVDGATADFPLHARVGVSWMGGVDGDCWYCKHNLENLCDHPTFTGYTVNGGYAEFALVRSDFAIPLPAGLDPKHVAPLLCAGIIGFRSLRVAGVEKGDRVGLFGFGSSATLMLPILKAWGCETYVVTRGSAHRQRACELDATWVGREDDQPDVQLDRAITFAPVGDVILNALSSLRKGGVVAINAIHLDLMPQFNYDKLLWGERQIRSVTNMTRADAREFLAIADQLQIQPQVSEFSLNDANKALLAVKNETETGSAVILM
jgi:propanol-preferring alcohol dehydrogenase